VHRLFAAPRRVREATPEQIIATGAGVGSWGVVDPIDGDVGYRPIGAGGQPGGAREIPFWTIERARQASIAAYRSNPMARAIVDTYTAFAVGDSGVKPLCTNDKVEEIVSEFWNDPRNKLTLIQDQFLRDQLLQGETFLEVMIGEVTGVVRFAPHDPSRIEDVTLVGGNALWPKQIWHRQHGSGADLKSLDVVQVDDSTGLRDGEAFFWTPFKTLMTDRRGMPFLMPVLDQLDSYDQVLSNLIDRTALARYMVWDVTVEGGQDDVDDYIRRRGGLHVPPSGSVEVHNQSVTWDSKYAASGASEDSIAAQATLTQVAGGTGLSKHWLAEPEGTNRATSHTMAEPVRRRVKGVQRVWLEYMTELTRFAVDRAVAAGRLPAKVDASDPNTGEAKSIDAAMAVTITGPEIAAADAQITATVLMNLSTGLKQLVEIGALSVPAANLAAQKAWTDYVGVPYRAELDQNPDDLAAAIAAQQQMFAAQNPPKLSLLPTNGNPNTAAGSSGAAASGQADAG
jgi:hypothetical protein